MTIRYLQNGSDIRGIALNTTSNEIANFGASEVAAIGLGFIDWLSDNLDVDKEELKISIGRDPRLSGIGILRVLRGVCKYRKVTMFNAALSTTPAMFMSTQLEQMKADGAIMVTASHLPSNRNGLKFFWKEGGLNKEDITDILDKATYYLQTPEVNKVLSDEELERFLDFTQRTSYGPLVQARKKVGCGKGAKRNIEVKVYNEISTEQHQPKCKHAGSGPSCGSSKHLHSDLQEQHQPKCKHAGSGPSCGSSKHLHIQDTHIEKQVNMNSNLVLEQFDLAKKSNQSNLSFDENLFANITGHKNQNTSKRIPLMDLYCQHLKEIICKGLSSNLEEKPLEGLKVLIDAGNGSGGFFATNVLEPLGADVSTSVFLEPDGTFPNHIPNPENKEALKFFSQKVKEEDVDLGIIFDTDVDRSAAASPDGKIISHSSIIALAASLIGEEHKESTIVTDSVTSHHLTNFLEEKLSFNHLRYMRGYKNVINKAIELNKEGINCQLAMETSGHGAFKENYFLDDGAYLATKIIIAAKKLKDQNLNISYLIKDLKEPLSSKEFRIPIKSDNFKSVSSNILEEMRKWILNGDCGTDTGCHHCRCGASLVEPNFEGVRINFEKDYGNGWCLLRASLHDPIMVLNLESDEENGIDLMLDKIKKFLLSFPELDLSVLK